MPDVASSARALSLQAQSTFGAGSLEQRVRAPSGQLTYRISPDGDFESRDTPVAAQQGNARAAAKTSNTKTLTITHSHVNRDALSVLPLLEHQAGHLPAHSKITPAR
jgi:hypothetical protein